MKTSTKELTKTMKVESHLIPKRYKQSLLDLMFDKVSASQSLLAASFLFVSFCGQGYSKRHSLERWAYFTNSWSEGFGYQTNERRWHRGGDETASFELLLWAQINFTLIISLCKHRAVTSCGHFHLQFLFSSRSSKYVKYPTRTTTWFWQKISRQ